MLSNDIQKNFIQRKAFCQQYVLEKVSNPVSTPISKNFLITSLSKKRRETNNGHNLPVG